MAKKPIKGVNDLITLRPNLVLEWHPTKNGILMPQDTTCGSHKEVWWKCNKCGYEWKSSVNNRSRGNGCPVCANKKIVKGINDLFTTNPELKKEWDYVKNTNIKPYDISYGSSKKVWWKCPKCGYSWQTSVSHRTNGRGCPCCSNKAVFKGINDFQTHFPFLAKEWDYDKNENEPDEVTPGSNKKVWWKCPNGHDSYLATISHRCHGSGCPICNTILQTSFPEQSILFYIKKIYPDTQNKFKTLFKGKMELDIYIPSLKIGIEYDGAAWHNKPVNKIREQKKYDICKANGIYLYRIREADDSKESADKVYTVPKFTYDNSSQLGEVIKRLIEDISKISNFDVDIQRDLFDIAKYKIIKYKDSLAYKFPDVAKEWHPILNKGLKPENVLPGTSLKVWWKCPNGHEWRSSVVNRTKGHGCDICAREQRKIVQHNTLISTRESLVGCKCTIDWDYSKNKHNPDYYTKGSGIKVWWKCHKCGHEWRTPICDRTRDYKNGCPACSNRILVRGKNDLLTTNPELCKEWDYERNGKLTPSDVAQWSHQKVWWKCSKCGYSYQASLSNRTMGKGCGCCAGRVVVPGKNDLATTRPDLALDWHPTKNGDLKPTDVTKGRRQPVWWKCHACGHEWQDSINHRNGGRGCSNCKRKNKSRIK